MHIMVCWDTWDLSSSRDGNCVRNWVATNGQFCLSDTQLSNCTSFSKEKARRWNLKSKEIHMKICFVVGVWKSGYRITEAAEMFVRVLLGDTSAAHKHRTPNFSAVFASRGQETQQESGAESSEFTPWRFLSLGWVGFQSTTSSSETVGLLTTFLLFCLL